MCVSLPFCTITTEPSRVWDLRGKIVILSRSLIGIPYQYGGDEIYGFDCSGFVAYVYDSFGIKVPRTARKQARIKDQVSLRSAKPGDILTFKIKGNWHTGIMLSDNTFAHAPRSGNRVREEKLSSYWLSRFKWAISIIEDY